MSSTSSLRPPPGLVTVGIAQGALRGRKTKTPSGEPLICFQGIPYAQPPIGPLRFKPPQPVESWTGIRDALQEGPEAFQYNEVTEEFVGSEDCLFLNVYTPKLPADRWEELLPVMVFIHGGGFTVGSGNCELYGPDHLVDQGVVVVTFNYRLGPLGFLCLGNADAAGNMGLKDQVMVLKWVQQNIASFGGHPRLVTIFGESAGSASVHLHVLSPSSRGLFQRAICQSGTGLNHWAISRNPQERAFRLAKAMEYKTKDIKLLFEFLRNADPQAMYEALDKSRTKDERKRFIWFTFVPCVEPELKGQEAFLSKHPKLLLEEGKFSRVPMIIGLTSHEGILLLKEVIQDPSLLDSLDADVDRMVPENLLPPKKNLMASRQLSDKVKHFYFEHKSIGEDTIDKLVDLLSDEFFSLEIFRTMKKHVTTAPNAPIYFYEFGFDGELNFLKNRILQGQYDLQGACHGDELGYLFRQYARDTEVPPDSPEALMVQRMTKLWTNFARTGNPTPELDEDILTQWKPYTLTNPCHLKIGSELVQAGEYAKERMEFWDVLYRVNFKN